MKENITFFFFYCLSLSLQNRYTIYTDEYKRKRTAKYNNIIIFCHVLVPHAKQFSKVDSPIMHTHIWHSTVTVPVYKSWPLLLLHCQMTLVLATQWVQINADPTCVSELTKPRLCLHCKSQI